MRSYRHEARRELIGKIHGPGLCHYRVKAHFLSRHRVKVGGETVLFWEDLCVVTVEGMMYLEYTSLFSAVYILFDLRSIT